MRSPAMQEVLSTCLEHAESLPVRRRASLYRGLAEFCGHPQEAREFNQLAADLDAADRRCREFAFKLSLKP